MTQLEKEIYDQKVELRLVFDLMLQRPLELSAFVSADHIYFIGCGSSYYLAITAAKYFSLQLGKFTKAIPGGEVAFNFEENIPPRADSSLAVLISRSGESTEMILAAQKLKEKKIRTFCVTLNADSKLFSTCDDGLSLPVQENSIVMTKSFSCMLLSLFVVVDLITGTDLNTIDASSNTWIISSLNQRSQFRSNILSSLAVESTRVLQGNLLSRSKRCL